MLNTFILLKIQGNTFHSSHRNLIKLSYRHPLSLIFYCFIAFMLFNIFFNYYYALTTDPGRLNDEVSMSLMESHALQSNETSTCRKCMYSLIFINYINKILYFVHIFAGSKYLYLLCMYSSCHFLLMIWQIFVYLYIYYQLSIINLI